MTTGDPRLLLHAPLGDPGSGRVRYGAAMALFHQGSLTAAQLEVYREAAAFDARDPAPILAERGLPAVPAPPAWAAVQTLLALALRYLTAMHHAGEGEVRAGLARIVGPPQPVAGRDTPVVARWLSPALAAIDRQHEVLARAIAAAAQFLCWTSYDRYPRAEIGEAFATGHSYAVLAGDGGPFAATDFELGLFLIAPQVLYRDHIHAAPELYAPLTGPHGWRFTPEARLILKPAHAPVWNPSNRPHLTKVGPAPFLAFYVWTRSVSETAQVIPASDWQELAELTLG